MPQAEIKQEGLHYNAIRLPIPSHPRASAVLAPRESQKSSPNSVTWASTDNVQISLRPSTTGGYGGFADGVMPAEQSF